MDLSNKELQEKFDELSAAIVQVLQKGPKQSYEHVYRLAYTVTLYRKGPELYALVRSLTAAHLRTQFNDKIIPVLPDLYNLPSSPPSGSTSSAVGPEKSEAPAGGGSSVVDQEDSHEQDRLAASETFLNAVLDVWDEHKRCMGMLRDVLKYLEKTYIADANLPSIYAVSFSCFNDALDRSLPGQQTVRSQLASAMQPPSRPETTSSLTNQSVQSRASQMMDELREAREY